MRNAVPKSIPLMNSRYFLSDCKARQSAQVAATPKKVTKCVACAAVPKTEGLTAKQRVSRGGNTAGQRIKQVAGEKENQY